MTGVGQTRSLDHSPSVWTHSPEPLGQTGPYSVADESADTDYPLAQTSGRPTPSESWSVALIKQPN